MQLYREEINARSECSIACALDVVGDKWTLLIVRDVLLLGRTSFNEIRKSPEKIASNILTTRIEKLVKCGILTKKQNPKNMLKFDYEMTERGKQLEPIIRALSTWGLENVKGTNDVSQFV